MEDISEIFRQMYHGYMESKEVIKVMDEIYGDGTIVFVGKAMEYNDIRSIEKVTSGLNK